MVLTKDPEPVWDKEVDVAEKWIQFVDESVSASKLFLSDFDLPRDDECRLRKVELPQGSRIKGIFRCGTSYWTRTAKIETEQVDGSHFSFFLKVAKHDATKNGGTSELMKQLSG